jgi:hypothetical protein
MGKEIVDGAGNDSVLGGGGGGGSSVGAHGECFAFVIAMVLN